MYTDPKGLLYGSLCTPQKSWLYGPGGNCAFQIAERLFEMRTPPVEDTLNHSQGEYQILMA